jgi:hypothetical protein
MTVGRPDLHGAQRAGRRRFPERTLAFAMHFPIGWDPHFTDSITLADAYHCATVVVDPDPRKARSANGGYGARSVLRECGEVPFGGAGTSPYLRSGASSGPSSLCGGACMVGGPCDHQQPPASGTRAHTPPLARLGAEGLGEPLESIGDGQQPWFLISLLLC